MIDNLFLVLAILQIFVIFLYAGPIMAKQMLYISLKKNPEWASKKENENSYKYADFTYTWCSRILAIVSSVFIINYTILNPSPEYYFELAMIPAFLSIIGFFILMAYVYGYLIKIMPKPEVVKAALSSRKFSDYMNPWVLYLGYGIMALASINYIYQFLNGLIEIDTLNQGLLYIAFLAILTFSILLLTLRRKHSEFDIMFGEKGRKYEVLVNVVGIYLLALVGMFKMGFDIYQIEVITPEIIVLFLGFLVNMFFLWMASHPKSKEITKDYHLKYSA